jgi:hypothetical protein
MKSIQWILFSRGRRLNDRWQTYGRFRSIALMLEGVNLLLGTKPKPYLAGFRIDLKAGTWEHVPLGPDALIDLDEGADGQLAHVLAVYLNTRFGFKVPAWHEGANTIIGQGSEERTWTVSHRDKYTPGRN